MSSQHKRSQSHPEVPDGEKYMSVTAGSYIMIMGQSDPTSPDGMTDRYYTVLAS